MPITFDQNFDFCKETQKERPDILDEPVYVGEGPIFYGIILES